MYKYDSERGHKFTTGKEWKKTEIMTKNKTPRNTNTTPKIKNKNKKNNKKIIIIIKNK